MLKQINTAVKHAPKYKFTLDSSPKLKFHLFKFLIDVSIMMKKARTETREKYPSLLK